MKEIIELKAKCYDIISNIEYLQKMLKDTNDEIAKKVSEFNEANKKIENSNNEE
jgi:flagellar hook-associated protein FlgK